MFEVKGVTKRYGKVIANDNISFDVKDGEIAVLLGPNGAGKSTIIKCIAADGGSHIPFVQRDQDAVPRIPHLNVVEIPVQDDPPAV